jgi:hypothetical protein
MTIRQYVRATVALIAAYAVALQTILLVFAGAVPAGAASFAETPICSAAGAAGTGSVPGHGQDCLTACLTGCCCGGAAAVPMPGATAAYAPEPARIVIAAIEATATPRPGMTAAHRSRAPPLA